MKILIIIILVTLTYVGLFGCTNESKKNDLSELLDQSEKDEEIAFDEAIETLSKFKRTAYLPITTENEAKFSNKSKMGGFPYLRNENDWPTCPNCKKNMQLFLQLNLETLPENKKEGLAQLFYCTTSEPLCESDMEAFIPFSESVVCRIIDHDKESATITPNIEKLFPERLITNWTKKDDYPDPQEYLQLGIEIDDQAYMLMEERNVGLPIQQDKLFGWPFWVQSVEYPLDRKTKQQMTLLFQIDSEDNLPYMFGDAGIGHLTWNPERISELGFGWSCY